VTEEVLSTVRYEALSQGNTAVAKVQAICRAMIRHRCQWQPILSIVDIETIEDQVKAYLLKYYVFISCAKLEEDPDILGALDDLA